DRMRQHFPILSVIITIAPMLGLLGTVTGIINSFNVLNALAGATDPLRLSVGIAEALITTAAGLIVAIPALLCYTYLNTLVERNVSELNRWGDEFLRVLKTKRGDEHEYPSSATTAAVRDH
ncbi:MAG TPA: MotA/TolQ/ExbB proton channel family protein, partial [Bacillota bacterium]|nr:MotA/TolQ/ExbB proton channel family protein [Bacillota bacterium]